MKCSKETLLLYAVTDRSWVGRQTLLEQAEDAIRGGATCVQLREKELEADSFLEEAVAAKTLCARYGVPLFINDNVEIAVQCGADGVHVGQSDLEAGRVRALVGEDMILGVSVHTVEQAAAAERAGADYLGAGAVFATATKPDAAEVSLETLRAICGAVSIPVVAIGGINRDNISRLAGSGICGAAVVSAIFGAGDIREACSVLRRLAEEVVGI